MFDENGVVTEEFRETELQEILGDNYYNNPDTKQEPTKMFDDIKDKKTFVTNYANAQRKISSSQKEHEEDLKTKLEGTVRIPTDETSDEDRATYRTARGVPKSADKYDLAIPKGDDAEGFKTIAKIVKESAHELGVSQKELAGVWGKVVIGITAMNKAIEDAGKKVMETEIAAMKAEKKEGYKPFIEAGDNALAKFKAGADVAKILETFGLTNQPAIRNLLAEIAPLVSERQTILGKGLSGEEGEGWPTDYEYDDAGHPTQKS